MLTVPRGPERLFRDSILKYSLFFTVIYLIAGFCWIYFSDSAVTAFFNNDPLLQTTKGSVYVLVTGLLLFLLFRHLQQRNIEIEEEFSLTLEGELQGQLLAERSILLSRLSSGVAHYINNQLQSIQSHAELLSELATSEKNIDNRMVGEITEVIRQESRRISDVLVRLKTIPQKTITNFFDIVGCVRNATDFVQKHHNLRENQLVVEDLPDVIGLAKGVERDLTDIILSVITNAVEATEEVGVVTCSVLLDKDRSIGFVLVKDTGIGMPKEVLNKLGREAVTTKAPGKGIGLNILVATEILRAYNGDMIIDSVQSSGTKVTIRIPLVEVRKKDV